VPGESAHWLATWPGVHGVMSVRADNESSVANRLHISTLLPGHDRITGVAACRDTRFSALFVYVTSYDEHRVWRYQLDTVSGAVVGQLQMLSPRQPRALSVVGEDCDRVCVSGSMDDERRVVQCYRVERRLDDDAISVDEWWVMISNYQWPRDAASDAPQPEALVHDPRATALEASPGGSLWIDTLATDDVTRFAVDSMTGIHFPHTLSLPAHMSPRRLSWYDDGLTVADADTVATVQWSTSGPDHWTVRDTHPLHVVAWRYALMDPFDRLALADNPSFVIERSFNRLEQAIALGEVSASSTSTASPMPTASRSPTGTAAASLSPTPAPTAVQPSIESSTLVEEVSGGKSHHTNLDALWALTVLMLPCCCFVALVAVAVARQRRKRQLSTRSLPMQVQTTTLSEGWTDLYDRNQSSFVAVPSSDMNSPLRP